MPLKNYTLIELPLPPEVSSPRDMDAKQARDFMDRFVALMPRRMEILKKTFVQKNKKIEKEMDFSPQSLVPLGEWFSRHITVRQRSKDEIKKELGTVPEKLRNVEGVVESWTFTPETISLCYDIAIYIMFVAMKKMRK